MNKPHRLTINGNDTNMCHVPAVTGIEHRKIEPIRKHLSHCKKKINLVGQTKSIDRREIRSYNNHV